MLNREQILKAARAAPTIERVTIKGFGEVGIRLMSSLEREQWEKEVVRQAGPDKAAGNIRASLLTKTLCDEDGNRMFNDDECNAIGEIPAKYLIKIYDKAQALNAVTDDDVDELAKN